MKFSNYYHDSDQNCHDIKSSVAIPTIYSVMAAKIMNTLHENVP